MIEIGVKGQLLKEINFDRVAETAFTNTGNRLVDNTRQDMQKPKSGKYYKFKGRNVRASGPDESPAVRSGRLFRSVRTNIKATNMIFGAGSSRTPYAKLLEEGTSRIKPRPIYEKVVRNDYANIEKDFDSAVREQF